LVVKNRKSNHPGPSHTFLFKHGPDPKIRGKLGLMNGDVGIYLPMWNFVLEKVIYRVVFPMVDGSLKKVLPSRLDTV